MTNSNNALTQKKPLNKTVIAWICIVVSFLGFADASYLTIEHLRGVPPNCSFLEGCAEVTSSPYSEIAGIPVALGGALYYLSILLLSIAFLDSKKETLFRLACLLTPLGFLASAYFVFLMAFVIQALCIYCLGSAISSTLLFILGMYSLKKNSPNL